MKKVYFWNGNKSPSRQRYETELLQTCLHTTDEKYGQINLQVDNTDYPKASDEADVFSNGADILVTVAGNIKFQSRNKIVIHQPLSKGLLGYRLLIVRNDSLIKFGNITQASELQALSIGVPNTWADAALFRHNGYQVVEKGNLRDIFVHLKNRHFDYVALGVNEITEIFHQYALPLGELSIEPNLMLYYPFPLVFYVNPNQAELAQRIRDGLEGMKVNNLHQSIFNRFHSHLLDDLNLKNRKKITLDNPSLPDEMANFSASFIE